MKAKVLILVCFVVGGCMILPLPESGLDHDERYLFASRLMTDPRIADILAHKPNDRISVLGGRAGMDIFANSPEILLSDGRRSPGNKYTPEEIAIIENVAVELKEKMKIKRHIYIYDDTLDQAHEVTESRQRFSPPTNPPADGKR